MLREERSERSRRDLLDAALRLFSHQGYRATSVREIATAAGLSTGNVYHHFGDKEAIFRELLEEFWTIAASRRFPFTRAVVNSQFPENLEALALAARESVLQFRSHIALIYVDVIEFDGAHIRRFYGGMAERVAAALDTQAESGTLSKLRPGVSAVSALLLTSRLFFSYFSVEILFGVSEPFGKKSEEIVREIADILRHGMLGA
jgi:AcrR family transcriptional regulator